MRFWRWRCAHGFGLGSLLRTAARRSALACGIFSRMGPLLTELFATRVRGSGLGFAYNFRRRIATLNVGFVGLLSASLPLGQSIGVFAQFAHGLVVIAALLIAETKGRKLRPPLHDRRHRNRHRMPALQAARDPFPSPSSA
jgi:hypothetical protein